MHEVDRNRRGLELGEHDYQRAVAHIRIDLIRKRAIPSFLIDVSKASRATNGWNRPRISGNYRTDFQMRTINNYANIWVNNGRETVTFSIDGKPVTVETRWCTLA